jgi:hypothetical protein
VEGRGRHPRELVGDAEVVHEGLTREACRRPCWVAPPAEKLAAELGFDDPAYFNRYRFIKRGTGQTLRARREWAPLRRQAIGIWLWLRQDRVCSHTGTVC